VEPAVPEGLAEKFRGCPTDATPAIWNRSVLKMVFPSGFAVKPARHLREAG
jgi:hypothetical protein